MLQIILQILLFIPNNLLKNLKNKKVQPFLVKPTGPYRKNKNLIQPFSRLNFFFLCVFNIYMLITPYICIYKKIILIFLFFARLNSSGVEQWTENPCVSGSNPLLDIKYYKTFNFYEY